MKKLVCFLSLLILTCFYGPQSVLADKNESVATVVLVEKEPKPAGKDKLQPTTNQLLPKTAENSTWFLLFLGIVVIAVALIQKKRVIKAKD